MKDWTWKPWDRCPDGQTHDPVRDADAGSRKEAGDPYPGARVAECWRCGCRGTREPKA